VNGVIRETLSTAFDRTVYGGERRNPVSHEYTQGDGGMASIERLTDDTTEVRGTDVEAALAPAEADGHYRDSRECAAIALAGGAGGLLLSPPTPRPKKG
jgi:hypothetical protein